MMYPPMNYKPGPMPSQGGPATTPPMAYKPGPMPPQPRPMPQPMPQPGYGMNYRPGPMPAQRPVNALGIGMQPQPQMMNALAMYGRR